MIDALKTPEQIPLADQIDAIVQAHGGRAVLLALMRAIMRLRPSVQRNSGGIPQTLRQDLGLPPEPYAPPRRDRLFPEVYTWPGLGSDALGVTRFTGRD